MLVQVQSKGRGCDAARVGGEQTSRRRCGPCTVGQGGRRVVEDWNRREGSGELKLLLRRSSGTCTARAFSPIDTMASIYPVRVGC